MALKFKPCTSSGSYKKGQRPYPEFDTISEGVPYPLFQGGSSSSTPAWDFPSSGHRGAKGDLSRFAGVLGGEQTPGRSDSMTSQSYNHNAVVLEEEDEPKEWMAQVEPGVHITFVSLPHGGNDLKRIRFRYTFFPFTFTVCLNKIFSGDF